MKNGLKNWVMVAGISQLPTIRFTFSFANSVKDVPACSKAAQKDDIDDHHDESMQSYGLSKRRLL